jgi:Protein of unknown function (DUF2924)
MTLLGDYWERELGRNLKSDPTGTVLVRDYHGQRHTVTVVSDGFDWQGATYPSLSAIARTNRPASESQCLNSSVMTTSSSCQIET